MQIDFRPDHPVSPEACKAATGKNFDEWFAVIQGAGLAAKRRDAIQLIYDQTGRGKDVWWPTTIWVEFERARGVVVKKDGRPEGYNICCTKSFKQPPGESFPHFATEAAFAAWVPGWRGAMAEGSPFTVGNCSGVVGRIRGDKDIRMTWDTAGYGPSEIEIQFNVMGGKTTINFYHKRLATRDEADGLRRAWGEALDRLKARVG
ncbi:MAG: SRPBCC domain-containing protein [Deltaproteobacteria bacterium]|nr:SRPBCC domain-containing protein [Deltaproteobacteria bacterium]